MKTISAQIPDAELSALVAEHVAGWTLRPTYPGAKCQSWYSADGNIVVIRQDYPSKDEAPFATSADAVLPLIQTWKHVQCSLWVDSKWLVSVSRELGDHVHKLAGMDSTFPRACCFALLASRGFTITP